MGGMKVTVIPNPYCPEGVVMCGPETSETLRAELDRPGDEPQWIVNDLGELGVAVNGRYFFLYKGDNIEYENGKHDDGTPILYRPVGKREFGETCKPDAYYSKGYNKTGRYTEETVFHPGLSFGRPEDGNWRPLTTRTKEAP